MSEAKSQSTKEKEKTLDNKCLKNGSMCAYDYLIS